MWIWRQSLRFCELSQLRYACLMRFVLAFGIFLALSGAACADTASASASTSIPVARKKTGAELRAARLDQLLAELHQPAQDPKNYDREVEIWQIWARDDSPTAEVLLKQASVAMQAQDYDASEQTLVQLVESYPKFAEGWNRRGLLYFMLKRYDVALIDVDHALSLEPRHFSALADKGMILMAMGKNADALNAFRDALAINPHMETVKALIKDIEKAEPQI